jgi:hypothetical protein
MTTMRDLPGTCVPAFRAWMVDKGLVFVHNRLGELPRAPAGGGRGRGGREGRGGGGGRGRGRGPGAHAAPPVYVPPVVG